MGLHGELKAEELQEMTDNVRRLKRTFSARVDPFAESAKRFQAHIMGTIKNPTPILYVLDDGDEFQKQLRKMQASTAVMGVESYPIEDVSSEDVSHQEGSKTEEVKDQCKEVESESESTDVSSEDVSHQEGSKTEEVKEKCEEVEESEENEP